MRAFLLPRVRACAAGVKQSVCLSSVVPTKIARSRRIGISATHKHNESVEIVEKPTSSCFKSFGKAHERRKYDVLLTTPINRTPMSWSVYCACSNYYYQPHPHVCFAISLLRMFNVSLATPKSIVSLTLYLAE